MSSWITRKIKDEKQNNMEFPSTLGKLKSSNIYTSRSIKEELRDNLIQNIKKGVSSFPEIRGFEDSVIPDLERAILSGHNMLLLGLRGQAKTRIARLLVNLLDEYIPIIAKSELMDDPLNPMSSSGKRIIEEEGDDTEIKWIHRSERFVEKLATPDVSIADLIGDVDPIKAANLKLSYSDERVIHFGLVPRAHRSIFVLNELPDLQARIQVALFNILQEGDIQIRGFKLRMPLDIQFVFTANPEDYTNRGSIVTPLKDRIESQILTHYPKTLDVAKAITKQEARIIPERSEKIYIPEILEDFVELISFKARESEFVDENSGVSARMSISAMENLISTAERRMLKNSDDKTAARITDFWGIIPSLTGKLELVYEGEQNGPYEVALSIIEAATQELFLMHFKNPDQTKAGEESPYADIKNYFEKGGKVNLLNDQNDKSYRAELKKVNGLKAMAKISNFNEADIWPAMELILHGLSTFNFIEREIIDDEIHFSDPLSGIFDDED